MINDCYPLVWSIGANGWMLFTVFHVTGIITDAEFNFIVHEPNGIIAVFKPRSLRSKLYYFFDRNAPEENEESRGRSLPKK